MESWSERWTDGVPPAVITALLRSLVARRELSRTYGHKNWLVTERMRLRIQAVEMSILQRMGRLSLRSRMRGNTIRKRPRLEPLLLRIKRSQLRWFWHLTRMPPGSLLVEFFWACPAGRRPGADPEHAGEIA